jgi:2-keto-3-deoxy-L-rhamnonate aldolase RhmA
MNLKPNRLKAALAAREVQLGLWTCMASPYATELLAGSGYDWLSLDMEHSPNDLQTVLAQLQTLAAYDTEPVVRLLRYDRDLIKQYLDLGARTLVLPNIASADEARDIVASMRYPGRGLRGVAGLQRANRWGRVANYHHDAERELCVLAQIESAAGVAQAREIAEVDGIDGLFVGPSDLAASLGVLGRPAEAVVQQAIEEVARKVAEAGKAGGILALGPDDAKRYIGWGYTMVGIGTDQGLLARASDELVSRARSALVGAQR